jgi:cytochrome P450
MIIPTILIGILTVTIVALACLGKKKNIPQGLKEVPVVKGGLPFVGHGFNFGKDIIGFTRECYQTYGKIFRVKIFRRNMIVLTDHALKDEFFKAKEDDMSMYDVLKGLYFGDAFAEDPATLPTIITLVKQTIKIQAEVFAPKIADEAQKAVNRLLAGDKSNVDISHEIIKFIACTSSRCFIGLALNDDFFNIFEKFTNIVNRIVVCTYFFPKSLIRFVMNPFLRRYRTKIFSYLEAEIQSYRDNPKKNESYVIRGCVDYVDADGNKLTNREVSEVIICLLYVSSENTALSAAAMIRDLVKNPDYWDRIKKETAQAIVDNDYNAIFTNPLVDACFNESARLGSHIFSLNRKPINMTELGGYYVGEVDTVALSGQMLMVYDESPYSNRETYNPKRFMGAKPEPRSSKDILTFGAGLHLCPGRKFAMMEAKMLVALFTNYFKLPQIRSIGKLDYFSPSAYAECAARFDLEPIEKPLESYVKTNYQFVDFGDKKIKVINLGKNVLLIKGMFDAAEEKKFYNYLNKIRNSEFRREPCSQRNTLFPEADPIVENDNSIVPLSYEHLVYTGKSNCDKPTLYYENAQNLWNILQDKYSLPSVEFGAMYSQLFKLEAIMAKHKDEHVNWGVSYSFGASALMTIHGLSGEDKTIHGKEVTLNSGDILIAPFGELDHSIDQILDDAPGWWEDEVYLRCSVQVRQKILLDNPISQIEFENMIGK